MNKILRVIFDTNVLVAAARSRRGASYQLISFVPSSKFKLIVSLPLYFEYLDVLMRPDVRPKNLSDIEIVDVVNEIVSSAYYHDIYFLWRPWLKDRKDDMLLELAIASQADYVVTFNLKDFKEIDSFGTEAVVPSDFLKLVRNL
ncbi:MAG: putative toxin-antitoxin system toxin component, PIN family [Acidobacteriota bacterium]|jgi:putative PIN family toxin of toxin-antitoxin system|nr:putative toxin-antitoxin system toxin component, PIN family [Acidobacteriota bacterium]MDQ3374456.1 putative toxin-antitoxin system toxin component, PIN family [Acidobacteriota bacterium]